MQDVLSGRPVRNRAALLFVISGLAATGCVSTRTVAGPDGTDWYESTCIGAHHNGLCAAEAARHCPDGYIQGADPATGATIYQCADDYVANRVLHQASSALAAPDGRDWLPSDVFVCDHVRTKFVAAAANWAHSRGGVARSTPPARDAFLDACVPLAQEAQGCLYPPYYEEHRAACDATIGALPPSTKQQLDAVFEEFPAAARSVGAPTHAI